MPFLAPALPYIYAAGAVAGIAGAGISAYSSYQQGKTANAIANYNAHQQELNAKMQLMSIQAQAEAQKRMAEAQFKMRSAEAQARFNNATSIENLVEPQSRNVRENIRRRGMEHDRALGTTRANIAKSGIVESSGTPLDIVANLVETMHLEKADMLYEDELSRRNLFREAELERFGGKMALAGATLDKGSSLAAAGLNAAGGRMQYASKMREAEITRLSGGAQQKAYHGQAIGTLFSGVSSAAGSFAAIR
jgi:hypothetical protein